jgi:hypothetical protein
MVLHWLWEKPKFRLLGLLGYVILNGMVQLVALTVLLIFAPVYIQDKQNGTGMTKVS